MEKDGVLKESIFAIGNYVSAPAGESEDQAQARRAGGLFTLAEARAERLKARGLVKQGINPSHERQIEKIKRVQQSAITFESVATEWLAMKDWEAVTKKRRLDMLQRVVFPKIGVLPVRQVTPPHILDVLQAAHKHNGPTVAAEARRTMSGVFEFAISTLRTCSWSRMKVWGMRFGMGCEAQTTAIAWLLRGFATTQTARSRARTPMRRS